MIGTKYRLGARIGAGGMAEVFRAELLGTRGFERTVAIKRVLPRWSESPRYAEMFVNEARILAALHHCNVVAVSDFARDDEQRLFLAMELIEGVALRRLLRTGAVPASVAIYIVSELLRGLGHMHEQVDGDGKALALVHRDLSPNNVLVSWEGAVKLSDFGLTKAYAGNQAGDSDGYGTPGYMSPEQVSGGAIDRRSDLFAVGVILYELLAGTSPFVGSTREALELAVVRQRIAPPRELLPEIPADLSDLTMQLLERKPAQRPATAHAVLDALEHCAAASPRGRTELTVLLQARCAASDAQTDREGGDVPREQDAMREAGEPNLDSEARRKTERAAPRKDAPVATEVIHAGAHASQALARMAQLFQELPPASSPAAPAERMPAAEQDRQPSAVVRPRHPTRRRVRSLLAAGGLLLVLGAAGGSLLSRQDDRPTAHGNATEAAPRMDGTCAITTMTNTNALEQPSIMPTPAAAESALHQAALPAARRPALEITKEAARLPRIPIERGRSLPTELYVKETHR